MSLDFWLEAERFYEFWLVFIFSVLIFILIIVIFIYSYVNKNKRRKLMISLLTFSLVLVISGTIAHIYYQPYIEQFRHVNPLIRDRQPHFLGYNYYGGSEKNHYSQLNDLEALQELVLYEEIMTTETVTYLGKGEHTHYFMRDNGEFFRHNRSLVFNENIQKTRMVGSRFVLKDEAFREIGFNNPANTMFTHIEIPAQKKGKIYIPEDETKFIRSERVFLGWNF